jgi:hypothetical protein
MRWTETLQEYDYEIVYVQGKFNVVADALSRINESLSTALYVGSEYDEDSDMVALNVVGTGCGAKTALTQSQFIQEVIG